MMPLSLGELHRIGEEIDQDLLAGARIGNHQHPAAGQIGLDHDLPRRGLGRDQRQAILDAGPKIEIAEVGLEAAGLDLGQVQNVGHQAQADGCRNSLISLAYSR